MILYTGRSIGEKVSFTDMEKWLEGPDWAEEPRLTGRVIAIKEVETMKGHINQTAVDVKCYENGKVYSISSNGVMTLEEDKSVNNCIKCGITVNNTDIDAFCESCSR